VGNSRVCLPSSVRIIIHVGDDLLREEPNFSEMWKIFEVKKVTGVGKDKRIKDLPNWGKEIGSIAIYRAVLGRPH
jgi:hypothetical protein